MNSRPSFPLLFYGTAWKKQKTAALVQLAIKCGFRGIDTACQPKHYNEAGVGQGIANSQVPRQKIFIQTKYTPYNGQDPKNIPYHPKQDLASQVRTSFAVSQKNLRTQKIDSLVLHSPLDSLELTMVVWRAFEELYESRKVYYLGISNCYQTQFLRKFYEQAKIKPTFLQNRFYQKTGYDAQIRQFCDKHAIIYQSFWTLTANPQILKSQEVKHLCQKYSRTPPEILYRVLHQMGVILLIGTTSKEHMLQDLSILKGFQLEQNEIKEVQKLFR